MEKIIISFTSYPARIGSAHKVVESLMEQSEKADEIVLWLSTMEFPRRYKDLPESISCLIGKYGFRVEWEKENLKSHKKYYYALQEYSDNIVITVDDDVCYAKTMVHTLMESYRKHPGAVSARNVHMIFSENEYLAPYIQWESCVTEYIGLERMDLCAIGVGGVLYPPRCADKRWFDKKAIAKYAQNQDDLWLKYNQIIAGVPVVYVGKQGEDILINGTQGCALHLENALGGANDICIKKLTEKLVIDYPLIYDDWSKKLISRKYFTILKKQYYEKKVRDISLLYGQKDIYICGAGEYAKILWDFIDKCGYGSIIKAFLVSEKGENEDMRHAPIVKKTYELEEREPFIVICGVSEKYKREMKKSLEKYKNCIWLDIDLLDIVKLQCLIRENLIFSNQEGHDKGNRMNGKI